MRENLDAWVRQRRATNAGHPRMSYKHATRMGIYRLHHGYSVIEAARYLSRFLDSHRLLNEARRNQAEVDLDGYAEWRKTQDCESILTRARLQHRASTEISLGGEIPRIDVLHATDEYRAVLVGEVSPNWQSELRMPLIQRAVAERLRRPEALVVVGVQNLDGSELAAVRFSRRRINDAHRELENICAEAARLLAE